MHLLSLFLVVRKFYYYLITNASHDQSGLSQHALLNMETSLLHCFQESAISSSTLNSGGSY